MNISPWTSAPYFTPKKVLTILILGAGGIRLGMSLKDYDSSYTLELRTCTTLPLPEAQRPRVDFVVMLVSMKSAQSLRMARACAESLDGDWLFGKSCVVAMDMADPTHFAVSQEALDAFCAEGEFPLIAGEVSDPTQARFLADAIVARAAVASGHSEFRSSFLRA